MKKYVAIITSLVICLCMTAQSQDAPNRGQNGGNRREFNPELYKKNMKEFVITHAKLTEAEATNVFPIINELHEKQHKLMGQQRGLMRKGMHDANLSEAEYEKIITQSTELDVEIKKLEQTYFKKLHSVLPWKKVYAVRMALNRFQMEALKQFRPERSNRNDNAQKGMPQKKN
ncbi:MAG: hypothetical protein J1F40_05490 [Prevotellaceae bacterium]|nr:hypothetical protein [Prevotellaceae bacterium]